MSAARRKYQWPLKAVEMRRRKLFNNNGISNISVIYEAVYYSDQPGLKCRNNDSKCGRENSGLRNVQMREIYSTKYKSPAITSEEKCLERK